MAASPQGLEFCVNEEGIVEFGRFAGLFAGGPLEARGCRPKLLFLRVRNNERGSSDQIPTFVAVHGIEIEVRYFVREPNSRSKVIDSSGHCGEIG